MIFLGICGASGSGKSTLARELVKHIGARCLVMNQDAYYFDHPDMTDEERENFNYDEPASFDHDLILQDVESLLAGNKTPRRGYDFSHHRRSDPDEMMDPPDVLIIEGIHTFHDPRLCEKMLLKIYVQVDPDVCLLRRIKRDMRDRGRNIEGIYKQYLATVKPMYEKHIRHYADDADVIVMQGGKNAKLVGILAGYVQNLLHKNEL
ncbi:MAG: uridine kinase [Clostridia bacterium]|nr:uridine kinase [Clostridia bacterium]